MDVESRDLEFIYAIDKQVAFWLVEIYGQFVFNHYLREIKHFGIQPVFELCKK
jgi:hypothetical protein